MKKLDESKGEYIDNKYDTLLLSIYKYYGLKICTQRIGATS